VGRLQATIIAQQRSVERSGQQPQDAFGRVQPLSHLSPQVLGGFDPSGKHLTQEVFERDDSGLQSLPGSLQTSGLDQTGRRIQTAMDLRPLIEIRLQAIHLDRSIGQTVGRQYGDGMTTTWTDKSLDGECCVAVRAEVIAPVRAMPMQPTFATKGTHRTLPRISSFTNLNARYKGGTELAVNAKSFPANTASTPRTIAPTSVLYSHERKCSVTIWFADSSEFYRPGDYRHGTERWASSSCLVAANCSDGSGPVSRRHSGGSNLVFFDGHTEWMSYEKAMPISNYTEPAYYTYWDPDGEGAWCTP
jgi:prepilin-type processing-associated H-X9-DG protein